MKINLSKIANPYLIAFIKTHGLKNGDNVLAHEYRSWITKKHTEFRKMKNYPPTYNNYLPDVQDEFENFILERRSQ